MQSCVLADINNYIELGGGVGSAPLQLYYQPGANNPEAFAWLTQPGIYYGSFDWDSSQHKRELDHLTNHRLLPYGSSRSEAPTLPLAVVSPSYRFWICACIIVVVTRCKHCWYKRMYIRYSSK